MTRLIKLTDADGYTRRGEAGEQAEQAAAERAAQEAADAVVKASRAAFIRLYDSPRDGIWARRWNCYNAEHINDERYKSIVLQDAAFMAAYRAVLDATTVPTKRKAIRVFLTRWAPEWLVGGKEGC